MTMKLPSCFVRAVLSSLALLVAGGCATSSPRLPYRKMYPGPVRSTNEIAIIHNDFTSGVYLEKTVNMAGKKARAVAVLPGKQELTFGYSESVPGGSYSSTKPCVVTETVEAGHQYQVVGFVSAFILPNFTPGRNSRLPTFGSSFSATLVDITTPDDVWKYYERELSDEHKVLAVGRIIDQSKLQQVVKTSPKPVVRKAAVKKITDAEFLKTVLAEEIDADVRTAVRARLQALAPKPAH